MTSPAWRIRSCRWLGQAEHVFNRLENVASPLQPAKIIADLRRSHGSKTNFHKEIFCRLKPTVVVGVLEDICDYCNAHDSVINPPELKLYGFAHCQIIRSSSLLDCAPSARVRRVFKHFAPSPHVLNYGLQHRRQQSQTQRQVQPLEPSVIITLWANILSIITNTPSG